MQSALIFLFKTLTDLYMITFLLRFILQWVRASYYNPLSQFVLKVTSPLVVPARRVLPSVAGLDAPTLIVLIALESLVTWVLTLLVGDMPTIGTFLVYVLLRLVALTLRFYTIALLIYVLLSWFGGGRGASAMGLVLGEVVEPVLRPVRRILPPIAGFDLSPLVVMLLAQAVLIALDLPFYLR